MNTKYKEMLLEKILPFWTEHAPDYECGGVFTSLDGNGKAVAEEKNMWLVSRALWTYSSVCEKYGAREEYLEICRNIYGFIKKCIRKDGKLPFIVSRKGRELEMGNNIHSECYAALACAKYFCVCKDTEVWEIAVSLFAFVLSEYERVCRNCGEAALARQDKIGVHLLVLYTAIALRKTDARYDSVVVKVTDRIIEKEYVDEETELLYDYEGRKGAVVPGNAFVGAWMLITEAEERGDNRMKKYGKRLLDCGINGCLSEDAGFVPLYFNPEEPGKKKEYRFWPLWEALSACRIAGEMFGDEKYRKFGDSVETVIERYFCNEEGNLFFCDLDAEKNVVGENSHGDLFHLPRALMMLDGKPRGDEHLKV